MYHRLKYGALCSHDDCKVSRPSLIPCGQCCLFTRWIAGGEETVVLFLFLAGLPHHAIEIRRLIRAAAPFVAGYLRKGVKRACARRRSLRIRALNFLVWSEFSLIHYADRRPFPPKRKR